MVKIVLISPILQHYRLTFYQKLSILDPEYDFRVFYGYKLGEDGRPSYRGKTQFKSKGFRTYKFKIFPFLLVYNRGMYKAVKDFDPDIVIIQGIAGDITYRRIISWARRKRKKVFVWACGWEPGRAKGLMLKFKNMLVKSFFHKADYFLTYSSKASKYIADMGFAEKMIETCYNGIETDTLEDKKEYYLFKAQKIRKEYEMNDFITFLYVGGLIKEKRPDLLIDAFLLLRKKYNDIKLFIIGDGPLRNEIVEKIGKVEDSNIRYLGRIINDVDAYFAASDCLVLPGVGGLALNQAMFWGKLCIVSEADGTEEDLVIDGVSGYRFKKNDLNSLIDAMERRIKENPQKLQKMSEVARDIIVKRSNVNNMVRHFSNAIEKMLSVQ